jgi:hypothetical protein
VTKSIRQTMRDLGHATVAVNSPGSDLAEQWHFSPLAVLKVFRMFFSCIRNYK